MKETASFGGLLRAKAGELLRRRVSRPRGPVGECAVQISVPRRPVLAGALLFGIVALSAPQARPPRHRRPTRTRRAMQLRQCLHRILTRRPRSRSESRRLHRRQRQRHLKAPRRRSPSRGRPRPKLRSRSPRPNFRSPVRARTSQAETRQSALLPPERFVKRNRRSPSSLRSRRSGTPRADARCCSGGWRSSHSCSRAAACCFS